MLKVEWEGPILHITLNRPEVRNALNDELIARLTTAFQTEATKARVVMLCGVGKGFCAGGDLDWMAKAANYTEEENYQDALKLHGLFDAMLDCPAAIIAKVHGACFGGGAGLVCMSDIAIAETESIFAFSEVRLGLVPATISRYVIAKIGAGHARALFMTGEQFDTERALRIGLIHEVVNLDDFDEAVRLKAHSLLKNGPQAVAKSKWLSQQLQLPAEQTARLLAETRASDEGREGVAAFLEKRRANFVVS